MRLRRALRKLRRLSWSERALALEALAWLGAMRLAIRLVPFRRIVGWMRLEPGETPVPMVAEAPAQVTTETTAQTTTETATQVAAERVGWAVRAVAARTPWESACLVQALAAARMLQARRLASTLYLGAARKPGRPAQLYAHAWLRCGGLVLTGESESHHFPVLTSFRALPRTRA